MNGNDNNGQPLDIIVQGMPITKGSVQPWRTKHGKAVSVDARLQSWEAAIRGTAVSMMTASGLKPYDCPISITGEIRVPRTDMLHDLEEATSTNSNAPSATRSKPPTADTPAETARE
mgnify:CR=1 FL=1